MYTELKKLTEQENPMTKNSTGTFVPALLTLTTAMLLSTQGCAQEHAPGSCSDQ